MGFLKQISTLFRGREHDKVVSQNTVTFAPASLDNFVIGAFIEFGFLPLQPEISGKTFTITAVRVFELLNGEEIEYAELDHGECFIRKEGRKIEVLLEIEDQEAFLECVADDFHDVLDLQDHEFEIQDGVEVVIGNENKFNLTKDIGFLKTGLYRVIRDVKCGVLNNQNIRYIRAKATDGATFVTVFYDDGGDTHISGSCLVDISDVSFSG